MTDVNIENTGEELLITMRIPLKRGIQNIRIPDNDILLTKITKLQNNLFKKELEIEKNRLKQELEKQNEIKINKLVKSLLNIQEESQPIANIISQNKPHKLINTDSINNYFDRVYLINGNSDTLETLHINYKVVNSILKSKFVDRWRFQKGEAISLYRDIFDETIYLKNNPDLKGKIVNKTQAWNHYTNYGSKRKLYDKTQIQYEEDLKRLMLHIEAIDDAIQRNYNRILIIDGDNVFHNDFNYLFKKNIEMVPEDWQLIFFGGYGESLDVKKSRENRNTWAYGLNKTILKVIKSLAMKFVLPLEECLIKIQNNYNCYNLMDNLIVEK